MFYDRAMEASNMTVGSTRLASWTNSAGLGLQPLNGHYTFQSDGKLIDLDALIAALVLG